jgi:ankyrin repeat protein
VPDNFFPRHATDFVRPHRRPLDYLHLQFLDYSERFWFLHSRKAELAENNTLELEKKLHDGKNLVLELWEHGTRLLKNGVTFRHLYNDLLKVTSNPNLSSTVTLFLKNQICFGGLQQYPHGAKISELNGWQSLYHAASWGHLKLVQALLDMGSDEGHPRAFTSGHTGVDIAAIYGHENLLETLLCQNSTMEYIEPGGKFVKAIKRPTFQRDSIKLVTEYLMDWAAGFTFPTRSVYYLEPLKFSKADTALRKATREENTTMMKHVLDWGFIPNDKGGICGTALSDATKAPGDHGIQALQLLLDYGADPSE